MHHDEKAAETRFLELLRPIERDLEVYCRRMVWELADTPDAIQNAVLRAFRAFDRYHENASFRAWMFKILTNEIFAINRKRGRIAKFEIPVEPEEMDTLTAMEQVSEYTTWLLTDALMDTLDEKLVAALKLLSEVERAVLLSRSIGGLRYAEISDSLEIPLGSVMGYLHRARQKMRESIVRSRKGRPDEMS